ncbi:WhiB family transcriptional regulator [Streptomyces sp. NPDC048442]|uniref:WhiB family transcriptional regulator n=1 Tax=Streptomyces sp. NPDC048442 TaxID=3154823 RepID=UPI003434F78D
MTRQIAPLLASARSGDWNPLVLTALETESRHWTDAAACSGRATEDFFPAGDAFDRNPTVVKSRAEEAGNSLQRSLNTCARCPLATQARCLVEALEQEAEYGVRAGLLASEREDLHMGWKRRVRDRAVTNALNGVSSALSQAEFKEAISRFARSQGAHDAERTARGLGITRSYLLQLVRNERKKFENLASEHTAA